jgi:23S rRNA (cytosine1962-C5)-methyltransferase
MDRLSRLTLKRGRERAVQQRHPWLFSGAVKSLDDDAADGDIVDVFSSEGDWLARGYLNRHSQIVVRFLSWNREEQIDREFWRQRLLRSVAGRAALRDDAKTTAYRLVNAESDGLPGLIVDRYGDWLVLQALTLGIHTRKGMLAELLAESSGDVRGVYERSDVDVLEKEGLEPQTGVLWGEEPDGLIPVLEQGHHFLVDIRNGHKTGFYLDQRENRARLSGYCDGAEVLNAFAYTGAFGVYALTGGAAAVVNVDTAVEALELAKRHVELNALDTGALVNQAEDVFAQLRAFRAAGRQFDVIVLDPPRFASARSQIKRASRGYKDINWVAFQIMRRGGILFTFSCSGVISRDLFQKIVFGAALDAGRDVQIIGQLSQAQDHPVALNFPEAEYLKGFVCRVW